MGGPDMANGSQQRLLKCHDNSSCSQGRLLAVVNNGSWHRLQQIIKGLERMLVHVDGGLRYGS
jgi:hypothetical protein